MTRHNLKIIFFIISVLCICLAGCGDKQEEHLSAINALADKGENDSALILLSHINPKHLSSDDRAVYNLVKVKAMYRSYRVLRTDSLINYSIAYFKYHGQDSLLADAYYYKAAMASDRDKDKAYTKVMACLRAAESIAVKRHYVDIEKKIYDRASNYNIIAGEYQTALRYAKAQEQLAVSLNDNYFQAYALNQLLKSYYMLEQKDSVRKYIALCQNMQKYVPKDELPDYQNDLYVTLGLIDPQRAISGLEALTSNNPSPLFLGNLACLYDKTGQRSKADDLWDKALRTENLYDRAGILTDMVQRKQADHLYQEAMKAQNMLNAVNDTLRQRFRSDDADYVAETGTSKVYYGLEVSKVWRFIWVLASCLLIAAIGFFFYHRRQQKRNLMFYEVQEHLSKLKDNLEKDQQMSQDRISMLEEALAKLKDKHAQTFSHGRQLYEEIKGGQTVALWRKQDFIDFIDYYMSVDFKYLQTLYETYKDLTPSEIFYLILVHEGHDDDDVMRILAVSNTAMRVRKSRINKKRREE